MQINDVVVSYQVGEGIVGLARLASVGYPHNDGYWTFDLKPKPTVWFPKALRCSEMRRFSNAKRDIEFIRISRGTVFRISRRGFESIINALLTLNPEQSDLLEKYLAS
jgi:hypothetical protein